MKTRIAGFVSRTARITSAPAAAIAPSVSPGSSQERGTNDGAARW